MVVIDCAYPGCAFQSEDAPEAVACAILQSHAFSHATPGPNSIRAPSEGPKLTRPSIDVGVSLEAWNVFTRRWQMFRQGSGINEASATAQLFQYCFIFCRFISDVMIKQLEKNYIHLGF